ncbi:MAG: hypothetical protein A2667_02025 [Candidatus Wildermuthbacteria bacterium RIFCSPHIGHO2_01_FULL_47_27]|uniref:DDH domain-containing protein n=1 Tax=Candidatus Wildermuthbacteria bacterium RIFCSPHIGHO2_02_FULL_47_17 TaxID=1802452 RepID=A0A1G2R6T4_9BACT|nr:MAG: hypothetical protein A2667_02025 [Candidatus Wildermuthbacteria bacterium RIFCSPHIGHO2_01_FULL_47_27]OHA67962.1 MAG: hypothetical protein A3D59_02945 [Candidatus Wildermuthbacteria bacterium RIFCSPHIGHO2_02_FULL_47_17]
MFEALAPQFRQINDLLKNSKEILLSSHEYSDADAVGSLLALKFSLERQGKKVCPYIATHLPRDLYFLPDSSQVVGEIKQDRFDLAFGLDYGDFYRLKLPDNIQFDHFVTIDHHLPSTQRGDIQIVAPEFSSTAELLYWWFKFSDFPIDKRIAGCLVAGIASDTGGFQHISTSAETLKAVADLMSYGVSLPNTIKKLMTFHNDGATMKLCGRVLSRISLARENNLAYSFATLRDFKECGTESLYAVDMPNLIAAASQTNLGLFLIEEEPGYIRGSLRAEPYTGRDVSLIARAFGGGGHQYAAGFHYRGSISEALQKVQELLE